MPEPELWLYCLGTKYIRITGLMAPNYRPLNIEIETETETQRLIIW